MTGPVYRYGKAVFVYRDTGDDGRERRLARIPLGNNEIAVAPVTRAGAYAIIASLTEWLRDTDPDVKRGEALR